MKKEYQRFVELSNKGAKELGFADTGAMWRSKYDMPADAFTKEVDRLWDQVRPLYLKLHAYARLKLREKYGDDRRTELIDGDAHRPLGPFAHDAQRDCAARPGRRDHADHRPGRVVQHGVGR